MKITDPIQRAESISSNAPAAKPAASSSAPGHDQVQLSRLSASLSNASSPAHIARLHRLADAVSKGRYQVDASQVSASLIRHSLGQAA